MFSSVLTSRINSNSLLACGNHAYLSFVSFLCLNYDSSLRSASRYCSIMNITDISLVISLIALLNRLDKTSSYDQFYLHKLSCFLFTDLSLIWILIFRNYYMLYFIDNFISILERVWCYRSLFLVWECD